MLPGDVAGRVTDTGAPESSMVVRGGKLVVLYWLAPTYLLYASTFACCTA